MRCGCPDCGTWMINAESMTLGCVCPQCGYRCTACLGTNTVISREELRSWKKDPVMEHMVLEKIADDEKRGDEEPPERPEEEDEKWRG